MTVQNSLFCRWLLGLWQTLRTIWSQSALGGWFHRRRLDFQRAAADSVFCRWAAREGALRRAWGDSGAGKLLAGVLTLPQRFCKWLYRRCRGLWDGSAVCRGASALGRRAWLLVGLFTLVMLVAPHESWDNLYAFLGATAIFFLYAVGCANRDKGLEVGRMGPYFAFYVLFITLGLVLSLNRALSLRFYLFHLTCFFLALVVVSAVETYGQLRALLVCAAVGLTLAAVYGCYQGYVGVEVVASQQDLTLNAGMPGRIYSFFNNPNNFAEVLVMFIPLVAALTLNAKGWRGRLLGVASLALSVAAIGMTYGRACWLGLVLAVVVALALLDWRFVPGLLVVGVVAIPFLPTSIVNRILTIGNMKDSSARYRIAIYEDTGRMLRDHGLLGVGLGSDVMKAVFKQYPTLYDGNYPIHTHNNYLQMWGEVGFFGLLAFLGLVFGQVKEGLGAFRRADKELKRVLAAALGSFVGILAIGLVEYTWFYPRNMFLFWVLFGVVGACVKLVRQETEQR